VSLLLVLLVLAGLRYGLPAHVRLFAAPALLVCVYAGLTFPDLDQPLPLDHRSALTHGFAPALVLTAWPWARAAAAGLALGLGFHLVADIFPNAMTGYATVAVPFAGRLDAGSSYVWLIGNAAACGLAGAWLLDRVIDRPPHKLAAFVGTALIGLWYLPRVDGGLPALLLLTGLGWLASRALRIEAAR